MELLTELIEIEIRKILSGHFYSNTLNTGELVFTFHRFDEGVVFYFNDNSLKEIEKYPWVDINYHTAYEFKNANELSINYRSFTTLLFNNKPVKIFIPFKFYTHTEPRKMIATNVEYYGGWSIPCVSTWTEVKEIEKKVIDEQQLVEGLKKAKYSFIQNVHNRMYLNSLYKTYKKYQEAC